MTLSNSFLRHRITMGITIGAIAIAFSFHQEIWRNNTSATQASLSRYFPTIHSVNAESVSNTSLNWSGYEAINGTFTTIHGSWIVPNVLSASSTEADATWIGIGGITSKDLIQIGTQAIINPSGAPSYQAWYETLPQATTPIAMTVSPGDSMSASLTETTPGEWTVSIQDTTNGQHYENSITYTSSLSSAEWIEEMPSDGTNMVPLDQFGTVSFSDGMTTENGNTVTIAGANAQPITMTTQHNQVLASPSPLGADNESFIVSRSSVIVAPIGTSRIARSADHRWHRTGVGIQGYTPTIPTSIIPKILRMNNSGRFQFSKNAWQQRFEVSQQSHTDFRNTFIIAPNENVDRL